MAEATADLRGVELDPVPLQAGGAHVVDVEAEVPSVHDGQNHAQGVLGLVGVGQTHLRRGREIKDVLTTTHALVHVEIGGGMRTAHCNRISSQLEKNALSNEKLAFSLLLLRR